MNTHAVPKNPPDHLPSLDGLRGMAILLVLLHNFDVLDISVNHTVPNALVKAVLYMGWIGVQLFFVLSGFLITRGLIRTQGSPDYFRGFFVRRVLRIFPLYYLALLLFTVLLPGLGLIPDKPTQASPVWMWLYLVNWTIPFEPDGGPMPHFWSLAVEEQFYLLWPLLLWRLSLRDIWVVCLLMVALTPVLRLLLIVLGAPPEALYEFTISRMDALAAGSALAVWIQDRRTPAERGLPARPPSTTGPLVLGLVLLVITALVSRGFQRLGEIPQVLGYTLLAATFTAFTAWAVLEDQRLRLTRRSGRLARVLRWPVLRSFGKYSYAIYVFHKPLHDHVGVPLLKQLTGGAETGSAGLAIGYFLAATLLTWGIGWLSWQLFERHFMALKDRFSSAAPAPVDPDAPTALDRALAAASSEGGPVVHGTVTAAQRRNFRPRAAKGRGLLRGNPAPRR